MARNLPGPYAIEIGYTVSGRNHSLLLNCIAVGSPAPGTPATGVSLATRSGGSINVATAANDVWGIVRLSLNTGAGSTGWTLWRYDVGSDDKVFITAGAMTVAAGASAIITVAASYQILSMRTGAGGIMKVTILDTVHSRQDQLIVVPSAAASTLPEKLSAYMLSASGWIIGRDDSYPVAALRQSYGQNETVWKKINRVNG